METKENAVKQAAVLETRDRAMKTTKNAKNRKEPAATANVADPPGSLRGVASGAKEAMSGVTSGAKEVMSKVRAQHA